MAINIFMLTAQFRYSAKDIWLIAYTIVLGLVPFFIINYQISFWVLLLTFPVHAWLITNLQNSCLHHHSHWPTFYNKKLNFAYEILLSIVGGIPHQIWKYHHLKHHIHVNDKPIDGKTKDPVSVFLHGKNNEVQNFWLFCFKMTKEAFVKMVVFPKFGKQVNHTKQILEQLAFNFYFLSFFV